MQKYLKKLHSKVKTSNIFFLGLYQRLPKKTLFSERTSSTSKYKISSFFVSRFCDRCAKLNIWRNCGTSLRYGTNFCSFFIHINLSWFRTFGKFTYQLESSYSIGTVGYEDVDCDTFDHTYVRWHNSSSILLSIHGQVSLKCLTTILLTSS